MIFFKPLVNYKMRLIRLLELLKAIIPNYLFGFKEN